MVTQYSIPQQRGTCTFHLKSSRLYFSVNKTMVISCTFYLNDNVFDNVFEFDTFKIFLRIENIHYTYYFFKNVN